MWKCLINIGRIMNQMWRNHAWGGPISDGTNWRDKIIQTQLTVFSLAGLMVDLLCWVTWCFYCSTKRNLVWGYWGQSWFETKVKAKSWTDVEKLIWFIVSCSCKCTVHHMTGKRWDGLQKTRWALGWKLGKNVLALGLGGGNWYWANTAVESEM